MQVIHDRLQIRAGVNLPPNLAMSHKALFTIFRS
jgi:hypothetical protein